MLDALIASLKSDEQVKDLQFYINNSHTQLQSNRAKQHYTTAIVSALSQLWSSLKSVKFPLNKQLFKKVWKRSHKHKGKKFQFQHFKLQINTTSVFHLKAFNLSNHSSERCDRKTHVHTWIHLDEVNCEEHIFFVQSDSDPPCPRSMKTKALKSGADRGASCHQPSLSSLSPLPAGLIPTAPAPTCTGGLRASLLH